MNGSQGQTGELWLPRKSLCVALCNHTGALPGRVAAQREGGDLWGALAIKNKGASRQARRTVFSGSAFIGRI